MSVLLTRLWFFCVLFIIVFQVPGPGRGTQWIFSQCVQNASGLDIRSDPVLEGPMTKEKGEKLVILQQAISKCSMRIHSFNPYNNPKRQITLRPHLLMRKLRHRQKLGSLSPKSTPLTFMQFCFSVKNQYTHLYSTLDFSLSFLLDSLTLIQTNNYFPLKSILWASPPPCLGGHVTLPGRLVQINT